MARARTALGRFRRSRISPATVAARRLGRFEPITGAEVSGVVSGETIVLGEQQTSGGGGPVSREGKAKS